MTKGFERVIDLACSRDHAFKVFTQRIDLWWPKTHRKDSSATLVFETGLGGRLFECSADGTEWTIGTVTQWHPPDSLQFDWFPGSPAAPTNVWARFEGDHGHARIIIEHRALSAEAGDIWPERIALFEKGWDTLLPSYSEFCQTGN